MCGIVGYIGPGACREILLAGLARLEYRGYDSAGIAVLNGDLKVAKCAGRVRDLEARSADLPATAAVGIGLVVAAQAGSLAAWALWAGLGCLAGGAFSIFEGVKGWCVVRALGFKTPM